MLQFYFLIFLWDNIFNNQIIGGDMSYIEIDKNKCKSCYLCMDVCPFKLIKKSDATGKTGELVVEFADSDQKCIGCAQCAMVCPDIAITKVIKS